MDQSKKNLTGETFFAPAARASKEELSRDIAITVHNPIVDVAMKVFGGLIAVLNEHRQVVALNQAFLENIGVQDPQESLGLRPGEVVNCIHATDHHGGCGTGRACASCAAAIAIVTSIKSREVVEGECAITTKKENKITDLYFNYRVSPLDHEGRVYLLIFLQDINESKRKTALERAFFHDMSNIIQALCWTAEMLSVEGPDKCLETVSHIQNLAMRLNNEVQIQRTLTSGEESRYPLALCEITIETIVNQLKSLFEQHPVATGKSLEFNPNMPDLTLNTDKSLILRILTNMIINALEAIDEGEVAKFRIDEDQNWVCFSTWNQTVIPSSVSERIFERHFTTKSGPGRGTGTFAMKFFGERFLKGKVDFSSTEEEGTIFRLKLPL